MNNFNRRGERMSITDLPTQQEFINFLANNSGITIEDIESYERQVFHKVSKIKKCVKLGEKDE